MAAAPSHSGNPHPSPPPARRPHGVAFGVAFGAQDDVSCASKVALLPPQSDTSAAQGDAFSAESDALADKVTVFAPKLTVSAGNRLEPCHKCQPPSRRRLVLAALALFLPMLWAAPLAARDSLGVFEDWGAFVDPSVPRCYAIAAASNAPRSSSGRGSATSSPGRAPFASVGTWPRREVRGQVHVRLSRAMAASSAISLSIGGQRFELTGAGSDAWAKNRQMDAAIVAAMRSAGSMSVSARDRNGRRFTDRYSLAGAATAMDAATVGCARIR